MDDLVVLALVLGGLSLVFAGPVLAIVALVQVQKAARRVAALERQLASRVQARPAEGTEQREQAAAAATPPAPAPHVPPSVARVDVPATTAPVAATPPVSPAPTPAAPKAAVEAAAIGAAAPPPPPARPPRAKAPPPPPREPFLRRVAWEQWVGVRGAAVLGGVVLALAAILFVKYAFEHQWIGGAARCWLGAAAGAAAIVGGGVLRRREVRVVPNALDGAGVVALFASAWAAHRQWGYLSASVALVLLALVTALACFLAMRHRSQLTAVLGLVGGFAAAFLLSEQGEKPIGLFGYLLLLDLGLLFVGRRSGWPSLGVLALLGTFFFQGLYVFRDLDPEHVVLALGVLAVFAAVFGLGGGLGRAGRATRGWFASQAGAVLLPFVFALRFAGATGFQDHIWPVFGLVVILAVAACVLARTQGTFWLALGAAAAGLAVIGVWSVEVEAAEKAPWTLAGLCAGLVALFHAFGELDKRACGRAAALAAAGALLLVAVGPLHAGRTSELAGVVGLLLPAAALVRQAAFPGHSALALAAGALAGFGVLVHGQMRLPDLADGSLAEQPSLRTLALALAAGAFALHAAALAHKGRARVFTRHALCLFVVLGLIGMWQQLEDAPVAGAEIALLVPAAAVALAAAALGSAAWTVVGSIALAFHQLHVVEADDAFATPLELLCVAAGTLFFAAAPPLVAWRARSASGGAAEVVHPVRARRALWIAAALSPAPGYLVVHRIYVERFSDKAAAVPLVVAALLAGALALAAVRVLAGPPAAPAFRAARAAYAAAAIAFLAAALPVQLDFEWQAVWLALTALGLAVLARRFDEAVLLRLAAAAALGSTAILVEAALDPYHYEHSATPIASWITYAHLVPIAALLAAAWRMRGSTRTIGEPGLTGLCAVVQGFAWINLSILDVFSEPGSLLAFEAERLQARDLATSIAWAVYALGLLVAGTALHASPLRWTSLLLFLATIAKVFLFDLGELDGLHRVASLAGLAISLLAVSLLYQRFVFRRRPAEEAPTAT